MRKGWNMREMHDLFRVRPYLWTLDELVHYYNEDGLLGPDRVVIDVISIDLNRPYESKVVATLAPMECDK